MKSIEAYYNIQESVNKKAQELKDLSSSTTLNTEDQARLMELIKQQSQWYYELLEAFSRVLDEAYHYLRSEIGPTNTEKFLKGNSEFTEKSKVSLKAAVDSVKDLIDLIDNTTP